MNGVASPQFDPSAPTGSFDLGIPSDPLGAFNGTSPGAITPPSTDVTIDPSSGASVPAPVDPSGQGSMDWQLVLDDALRVANTALIARQRQSPTPVPTKPQPRTLITLPPANQVLGWGVIILLVGGVIYVVAT